MPFTYILYSSRLDKYYVGACVNLERRLYEHNIGHSKYTSRGIPWVIKYKCEYETLNDAKRGEARIKKMKSRIYREFNPGVTLPTPIRHCRMIN